MRDASVFDDSCGQISFSERVTGIALNDLRQKKGKSVSILLFFPLGY